jgi:hypothetical protein
MATDSRSGNLRRLPGVLCEDHERPTSTFAAAQVRRLQGEGEQVGRVA